MYQKIRHSIVQYIALYLYIQMNLFTFQKFDGHCVWGLLVPYLVCYVSLGWCCGYIYGECTFVHLAVVPFSQFGFYLEMGAK